MVGWLYGVVVCENDDVGGGVPDGVAHVETFVGKGDDGENTDAVRVDGVGEVLEELGDFLFGDDEDPFGFADSQLWATSLNSSPASMVGTMMVSWSLRGREWGSQNSRDHDGLTTVAE